MLSNPVMGYCYKKQRMGSPQVVHYSPDSFSDKFHPRLTQPYSAGGALGVGCAVFGSFFFFFSLFTCG